LAIYVVCKTRCEHMGRHLSLENMVFVSQAPDWSHDLLCWSIWPFHFWAQMISPQYGRLFTRMSLALVLLFGHFGHTRKMGVLSLTARVTTFPAITLRDSGIRRRKRLTPKRPTLFLPLMMLGKSGIVATRLQRAIDHSGDRLSLVWCQTATESLGWTHLPNPFLGLRKHSSWATAHMPGFHGEEQLGRRNTKCSV
jgi:hypothetical protein